MRRFSSFSAYCCFSALLHIRRFFHLQIVTLRFFCLHTLAYLKSLHLHIFAYQESSPPSAYCFISEDSPYLHNFANLKIPVFVFCPSIPRSLRLHIWRFSICITLRLWRSHICILLHIWRFSLPLPPFSWKNPKLSNFPLPCPQSISIQSAISPPLTRPSIKCYIAGVSIIKMQMYETTLSM